MYTIYLYVDENGDISESYGGIDGIIINGYDYEFEVSEEVLNNIHLYKVVDGQLVLK